MAQKKLSGKQIAGIFLLVAVVAALAAVFTAKHVTPLTIFIVAGVVIIASLLLNGYIASQRRKLNQDSSDETHE